MKEINSFNIYYDILKDINKKYNCFDVNSKNFKSIMTEITNYCLEFYRCPDKIIGCEYGYKQYLKDQLINGNFSIIDNYVNNTISVQNDYDCCKKEIYILYSFFCMINLDIKVDIIYHLIENNEIIQKLVNIIYNNFRKHKFKLVDNSFDNFLFTLIELHCEIFNLPMIEFEDNYTSLQTQQSYLNNIRKSSILTKEEEKQLFIDYHNGDMNARNKIIESNMRLVISIVNKVYGNGKDFLDMVEYGNIGLIKAVDSFDENKGFCFSTYASWQIRQSVIIASHRFNQCIKIPIDFKRLIKKYKNYCNNYYMNHGIYPTDQMAADELNVKLSVIDTIKNNINGIFSLNSYLFDDNDNKGIIDVIPDENINIELEIEKNDLKEKLISLFHSAKLTYKDVFVLINRYGLANKMRKTYSELKDELNCTGENVRKIEKRALKKLKECSEISKLVDYMNCPSNIDNSNKKNELKEKKQANYDKIALTDNDDPFLTDEYVCIFRYLNSIDFLKNVTFVKTS